MENAGDLTKPNKYKNYVECNELLRLVFIGSYRLPVFRIQHASISRRLPAHNTGVKEKSYLEKITFLLVPTDRRHGYFEHGNAVFPTF